MSCFRLQPATNITASTEQAVPTMRGLDRVRKVLIIFDLVDVPGMKLMQKASGVLQMKFGITRFDREEKAVAAGVFGETVHIEKGMVRLRQSIERQHTKNRRKSCAEHS